MRSRPRRRWPGRAAQPQPRIPASAEERVSAVDKAGAKSQSEFWLNGKLVGRAHWNPDGTPSIAVGMRNGALYGHQITYHDDGTLYAEPLVDGLLHGLAKQYDPRGRLLLVSPFRHGTGTDFWCDERGRLAEEHPLLHGKPSGIERWWVEDQRSIYSETQWLDGEWHGVARQWTTGGELDAGFPRFFVRGTKVSKRTYLQTARTDPSLLRYRTADDCPEREVPTTFLKLRQRARRLNARR